MSDISITQAAIGGAFALLGAFIGAALTRRTEFEKWLRQEKNASFAEFLRRLHDAREEAINTRYAPELSEEARSIRTTEVFVRLTKYESVARLYLTESSREKLSKLTRELWLLHTERTNRTRVLEVEAILRNIQVLLETELIRTPWSVRWPF